MGTVVPNRIMDFDKIMIQGIICNKKGYDTGEMFLEPKPAYLPISFLRHICPVKTYNK
jgi:hypothetical protein